MGGDWREGPKVEYSPREGTRADPGEYGSGVVLVAIAGSTRSIYRGFQGRLGLRGSLRIAGCDEDAESPGRQVARSPGRDRVASSRFESRGRLDATRHDGSIDRRLAIRSERQVSNGRKFGGSLRVVQRPSFHRLRQAAAGETSGVLGPPKIVVARRVLLIGK